MTAEQERRRDANRRYSVPQIAHLVVYETHFPEAPAMRLPRLLFTVRRMLVAVAIVAGLLPATMRPYPLYGFQSRMAGFAGLLRSTTLPKVGRQSRPYLTRNVADQPFFELAEQRAREFR